LTLLINGRAQPVGAQRLPRLDPFRALHTNLDPFATQDVAEDPSSADPRLLSYRCGFWAMAEIEPPADPGGWRLELRAELEGGGQALAQVGAIAPASAMAPLADEAPVGAASPRVAIAMASYEPPPDLFERQIESIRAQTHDNWVCVISDDCS